MNGDCRSWTCIGDRRHPKQANPVQLVGHPETIQKRGSGKLAGLVPGSPLVGSDLRAWHRLWTDDGQTRSYYRLVVQQNNAAAAKQRSAFEATKLRRLTTPVSIFLCFSRAGRGKQYAGRKCDS